MKRTYVSFGNAPFFTVEGTLPKFGSRLAMSDGQAADVIDAGAGILTVDDFESVGFTENEISKPKERKGPDYMSRHMRALELMAALREELRSRG